MDVPQILSEGFVGNKNLFPMSRIELKLVGRSACKPLTIPTELPRLQSSFVSNGSEIILIVNNAMKAF
jgi:hypothetical protein